MRVEPSSVRKVISPNSPGSSSLVVHFAEDVCRLDSPFSEMRYQPMKHIISMFQLGWLVIRLVGHRVCDISFSASWSSDGFDVEHITCGTLSSRSEGVSPTTSVFIDSVMHASCYACNSMPIYDACHSLSQHLSAFTEGFVRESCEERLKTAGGLMPSGDASKGERVNALG